MENICEKLREKYLRLKMFSLTWVKVKLNFLRWNDKNFVFIKFLLKIEIYWFFFIFGISEKILVGNADFLRNQNKFDLSKNLVHNFQINFRSKTFNFIQINICNTILRSDWTAKKVETSKSFIILKSFIRINKKAHTVR